MTAAWTVERDHGPAQAVLDRSASRLDTGPAARTVRILDIDRPAVVLGSGQAVGDVDADTAARAGVDVVKRRSGGGAVLLTPGDALWVDLIIPAGDPWWTSDVGRASWPVGKVWAAAVDAVGAGPAEVWHGPMRHTEWSRRVCLAGLGPGEVQVGSRKVVGISQRRTRHGALIQTVAVARWEPAPLLALLGVAGPALDAAAAGLAGRAGMAAPPRLEALEHALLHALMT